MAGGDVVARGSDVLVGIVEEDVGTERLQERPFRSAAQEQRLVEANAPVTQRPDHPFVRRRRTFRPQRRADRRLVTRRESTLPPVQRIEEAPEPPPHHPPPSPPPPLPPHT